MLDTIQVESPSEVRLDKYNLREEYTSGLANAIVNFYRAHEYEKL